MYKVVLTKQAEKAFSLLMKGQPKMGQRVAKALDLLAKEPESGIPLRSDLKGLYKYRIGPYRIIYQLTRNLLIVTVIDIGHRKDIYR